MRDPKFLGLGDSIASVASVTIAGPVSQHERQRPLTPLLVTLDSLANLLNMSQIDSGQRITCASVLVANAARDAAGAAGHAIP